MTYSAFLAQFNATGPEKAQGYFSVQFEGMSALERQDARAKLLHHALEGDTVDLDGLRLIGDADTVAQLAGAGSLAARFGPRWDSIRLETLWTLTGDVRYLTRCVPMLDDSDPAAQKIVAEMLARLTLPPALGEAIADRLLDGRHENIALPLTVAWLSTRGVAASSPADFSRHLPFVRSVLEADPTHRRELLTRGG